MLDGGAASQLPPAIVVGRTLSSYFVSDVQNNQEMITYTVYNEQAGPETGVVADDDARAGRELRSSASQTARSERPEPGLEPGNDPGLRPRQRDPHGQPGEPDSVAAGWRRARLLRRSMRGLVVGDHARRGAAARAPLPTPVCSLRRPMRTPPTRSSRKKRRRSTTTRRTSSTSCMMTSATTRISARCAVRGARSGRTRAMHSTSPAWASP